MDEYRTPTLSAPLVTSTRWQKGGRRRTPEPWPHLCGAPYALGNLAGANRRGRRRAPTPAGWGPGAWPAAGVVVGGADFQRGGGGGAGEPLRPLGAAVWPRTQNGVAGEPTPHWGIFSLMECNTSHSREAVGMGQWQWWGAHRTLVTHRRFEMIFVAIYIFNFLNYIKSN